MFEIGRLCVKLAGRDAAKKCVIVDTLDNGYVLIDGQTRRKKCNIKHLEPLDQVLKLTKGASHADISKEFKKLKIDVSETKPRKTAPRPKKQKQTKTPLAVPEKKPTQKKTEKESTKEKKPTEKEPQKEKKTEAKKTEDEKASTEKKELKQEEKKEHKAETKTEEQKDKKEATPEKKEQPEKAAE